MSLGTFRLFFVVAAIIIVTLISVVGNFNIIELMVGISFVAAMTGVADMAFLKIYLYQLKKLKGEGNGSDGES